MTDFYPFRSGLYKGIRRGELPLVKTCFDRMWAEPSERKWLLWRFPYIVLEEAFHRIGEVPALLRSDPHDAKMWLRQYYYLAIGLKSKDCYAFPGAKIHPLLLRKDGPELHMLLRWFAELSGRDPMVLADSLFEFLLKRDPLPEYEIAALSLLRQRMLRGGKYSDRLACMIGMLLIGMRGLSHEQAEQQLQDDLKRWRAETTAPPQALSELPWYCYDKHTRIGLQVGREIDRRGRLLKAKMSLDDFHLLWMMQESFFTPRNRLSIPKEQTHLTVLDSYWWPRLCVATVPPARATKTWARFRPEVIRLIEQALL
jgi:hypothetical protein